jgi:hypothetical protein
VASGRRASFVANSVVAARFLPVWLATGVLIVVAAIIAPAALQHTNWAFVLPYMTILAIAALGQMLVIMQAGIDSARSWSSASAWGRTTGWPSACWRASPSARAWGS